MKSLRGIVVFALLLSLPAVADAQIRHKRQAVTTVNDLFVVLNAPETANGSFQISGTWVGTFNFEATLDGAAWFPLTVFPVLSGAPASSATANGLWTFSGAFIAVRASVNAFSSGTAIIDIVATQSGGGGGGGFLANGSSVDNKNNAVVVPEICNPHLTSQVPIALSASGNTELVALTSGQTIYICDIDFVTDAAVTVKFIYGTGSACATGETAISGVMSYDTKSGLAKYYDGRLKTAEANAFCIKLGGAVGVNGVLTYRKIPTI